MIGVIGVIKIINNQLGIGKLFNINKVINFNVKNNKIKLMIIIGILK